MRENKADKYFKETLLQILEEGQLDKDPRPKWSDGSPAHTKFVTQKVFSYDISKGEFPINTLRPTALKGAFYDIEAIYIKQTNIIEEMNPMIHPWWIDFAHKQFIRDTKTGGTFSLETLQLLKSSFPKNDYSNCIIQNSIGQTYGNTVSRYDLVNKLLSGLEKNPFGRRHMINLWQEEQMKKDPKALVPCAYMTNWNIREKEWKREHGNTTYRGGILDFSEEPSWKPLMVREVDLTLHQRSQDFCMTASINPAQYVMFGMMVCNHLTFKTGINHRLGNFLHVVENCHIYDRHYDAVDELLERQSTGLQPEILLNCPPKDFYSHTVEDFTFTGLEGIKPLSTKLELAV